MKKLLYQWLKKYFDNPFKDEHSHLPYGAIDGPPGLSLHIYLSIIQELKDRISNDSWWLIVNNYHQQVLIVINECWLSSTSIDHHNWMLMIDEDVWKLMMIDDVQRWCLFNLQFLNQFLTKSSILKSTCCEDFKIVLGCKIKN